MSFGSRAARARLIPVLVVALAVTAGLGAARGGEPKPPPAETRPNIVVIMTDDQTVSDLSVMPRTQRLIGAAGATFPRNTVSYSLCCPSRATLFTGQYAHNHGVEGNSPPNGGFARWDTSTALPVALTNSGYVTGHIGKFLNGYGSVADPQPPVPPGWSEWYGSVDPTTYRMWGYTLNENGTYRTYGSVTDEDPALYQTDVYRQKAVDFITRRAPSATPFMLSVAFLAPHSEQGRTSYGGTPRPAPRHLGRFASMPLPKPPSYNEQDVSDKPTFVRQRPPIDAESEAQITANFRARRESLLSVDEAVADIIGTLRRTGELDNTYIVFTSDNGFFRGQHRIPNGKYAVYNPSTRVPLLLRGPGIPAASRSAELVSNIDLAPTIAQVSGAASLVPVDGRSLIPFALDPSLRTARPLLHEALQQPPPNRPRLALQAAARNYSAIRTRRYVYVEYQNGDRELYDLRRDPYQLTSVHDAPEYAATRSVLAQQLNELRTCAGDSCRAERPAPPPPG